MNYLLILLMVTILGVLFSMWLKQPSIYKNISTFEVNKYIQQFWRYFDGDSLMFIEHNDSEKFIQIQLYRNRDNQLRNHFSIPFKEWSQGYYDAICLALENENIEYVVRETKSVVCPRFIDIDEIESAEKAIHIVMMLMKQLNIPDNSKFRVLFKGRRKMDNR